MATVGCLGDVIFEVSREKIETVNKMVWSSGAKWESHNRHLKDPMLEYVGMESDEIKLEIHLSAMLGVDPMEEISKLFQYEREGRLLPMVLGDHAYGKYRWVIESTERTIDYFDGQGNLISADVSLNMKGYVK